MQRFLAAFIALITMAATALAASGLRPPPPGAFKGAPGEYTRFSAAELTRGFMALGFGSDMRIGAGSRVLHRFTHPIRARVVAGGSVDRAEAMTRILNKYAGKIADLHLRVVSAPPADLEVRLIDAKDFKSALVTAFGAKVADAFIRRTDPQCMTSVESNAAGNILHSVSFVIVDRGDAVFFSCAYHELLHAFGLPNHDQRNPWTALNQHRRVGYLTVYDRALLALLYDRRMAPGMTRAQARAALPAAIAARGLARTTPGK